MASTYLSLYVHVVFATKDRAPTIAPEWISDLHAYVGGIVRTCDAYPVAVGGVADHIHLLMGFRANQNLATIMRDVKRGSSVWAKDRWKGFTWQGGYAAFTLARAQVPMVVDYIARQEEHHRHTSSLEELDMLLEEHEVVYDKRYRE